jgi:DNA-binding response OmpR family regulator
METKNKKVLIVEDNEAYRTILEQKLSGENFDIITAQDGEDGLKIAISTHPDLVIIDLMLPKMNGAMVMNKIREDEWGRDVPVIILTNINPDDETLQKLMEKKPSYYLIKSDINLDDLTNKVNSLLNLS